MSFGHVAPSGGARIVCEAHLNPGLHFRLVLGYSMPPSGLTGAGVPEASSLEELEELARLGAA